MGSSKALYDQEMYAASRDFISAELAAAWEADPRCVECGHAVPSALDAALLVGSNRVAHREGCFVPALLRIHPQLKLLVAREQQVEVKSAHPIPRNEEMDRPTSEHTQHRTLPRAKPHPGEAVDE